MNIKFNWDWRVYYALWQAKYEAMTEREKRLTFWGGVFLVFFLYYATISTLFDAVNSKADELKKAQKLFSSVQLNATQIESLRKNSVERAAVSDSAKALGVVQSQLEQAGLIQFKQGLQQASDNSIQLKLKAVSFNQYLDFIYKLSSQYQITTRQFKVSSTKNKGEVNIDVELEF